jgi:hypothetical protein
VQTEVLFPAFLFLEVSADEILLFHTGPEPQQHFLPQVVRQRGRCFVPVRSIADAVGCSFEGEGVEDGELQGAQAGVVEGAGQQVEQPLRTLQKGVVEADVVQVLPAVRDQHQRVVDVLTKNSRTFSHFRFGRRWSARSDRGGDVASRRARRARRRWGRGGQWILTARKRSYMGRERILHREALTTG